MIKFILGFIAIIFVGLGIYVYTGKKSEEIAKSTVANNVLKEEVTEKKVIKPIKVAKEVSVQSKKIVRQEKKSLLTKQEEVIATDDYTSEDIENADLSPLEKDIIIMDAVHAQASKVENISLTKEDMDKIIEDDIESGIL